MTDPTTATHPRQDIVVSDMLYVVDTAWKLCYRPVQFNEIALFLHYITLLKYPFKTDCIQGRTLQSNDLRKARRQSASIFY